MQPELATHNITRPAFRLGCNFRLFYGLVALFASFFLKFITTPACLILLIFITLWGYIL